MKYLFLFLLSLLFTFKAIAQINDAAMQPIDTASTLILAGNQDAEIAYNNGVQLLNEKKYHEAIKAFDEALRHNPNFYRARQNKAVAYSSLEQYNSAIEELRLSFQLKKPTIEHCTL